LSFLGLVGAVHHCPLPRAACGQEAEVEVDHRNSIQGRVANRLRLAKPHHTRFSSPRTHGLKAQRLLTDFKEEFAEGVLRDLINILKPRRAKPRTSRRRPLNDSDEDYYKDEPVGVYLPGSIYPRGLAPPPPTPPSSPRSEASSVGS